MRLLPRERWKRSFWVGDCVNGVDECLFVFH